MKSWLRITKRWSDEDLLEIAIEVYDGTSTFINSTYVRLDWLETVVKELKAFAPGIHGGLYDLKAGEFGPEYAKGAFCGRFHFPKPGPLYVSTHQQSDYADFKGGRMASEAKLFLKSEPALLDRFIEELAALNRAECDAAILEGA